AWHFSQGVDVGSRRVALGLLWSKTWGLPDARAKLGMLHLTTKRLVFRAHRWSKPVGDRTLSIPLRSVVRCIAPARWVPDGLIALETMDGKETFALRNPQEWESLITQELAAGSE